MTDRSLRTIALTVIIALAACALQGCFLASIWTGDGAAGGSAGSPNQPAIGRDRFLGHLAVKGMSNDQRNLMTSIRVRPRLWETTPYVLFDENGFGETYKHGSPIGIDLDAIRRESERDAEDGSVFWGRRPVHVMINTEGWPLQWDIARERERKGASPSEYNRQSLGVYSAIQQGFERGWPEIDRFGWWSRMVTPFSVTNRDGTRDPRTLNMEAAPVWRRVSYFAGHIYPFTKLVPDHLRPGVDEQHAEDWVRPVHDTVGAMLDLRAAIGGDQLVLPCMFATSRGWRGKYKNSWMTEGERRLLVRASFDAGADGIMVWQPIRNEHERDAFQLAITHIEAELALINGDTDLGPSITLGEMFRIKMDWPGRTMGWMQRLGDQTLQPAPTR